MDDEGSGTGARSTRSSGSVDEGATFAVEGDGDIDGGGERGKADPTPSDVSRLSAGWGCTILRVEDTSPISSRSSRIPVWRPDSKSSIEE